MNPDDQLLKRVQSAYERGRLRRGLRAACLVAPMVLVSLDCCGKTSYTVALGVALTTLTVTLIWRGGIAGRAVVPGLVAGIASLVLPAVAGSSCGLLGEGSSARYCLMACVLGGLASGAMVAYFASRVRVDKGAFVFVAGATAALAGSLGCVILGLGGIVSMVVGLTLVSVPAAMRTADAQ